MAWQCFPNSVKGQEGKSPQWGGDLLGDFLLGGGSLMQAFIEAVSPMSVFEQRLRFGMFKDTAGCHTVMQALQRAHGGALEGVQGVKSLKHFGLFTSGGQTNISK